MALLFSTTALADQPRPTLDDFLAPVSFWSPTLSPSGRYVAALRREADETFVVTIDLKTNKQQAITRSLNSYNVHWIRWISEDRLLYSATSKYGFRTSKRANWQVTRKARIVVAMNRSGKKSIALLDGEGGIWNASNTGRIVDFLEDDPKHVLLVGIAGQFINLYKVNVFDGSHSLVAKGTKYSFEWYTDRNNKPVIRLDSSGNGSVTKVMVRRPSKKPEGYWFEAFRYRTDRNRPGQQPPEFNPLAPGPVTSSYYVAGRPPGRDTYGIHLYDYLTQTYKSTFREEPGIDITNALFDRQTHELLGVLYHAPGGLKLELEDPTAAAHLKALNQYFGNSANVVPIQQTRAQRRWLLHVEGPTEPGSYHVYDIDNSRAREIGVQRPKLLGKALASVELIKYRARDGLELTGYLTTPPNATGKPAPLLMYPHGGPALRDYYESDTSPQIFAAHGYQVFQPNFRGSAGFGEKFLTAGHRQWGRAMQTDIGDALAHLHKIGRIDSQRACIIGASYGGYAALVAATTPGTPYRCSAAVAPVTDLTRLLKHDKKYFGAKSVFYANMLEQLGNPARHSEELQTYSPAQQAAQAAIPILLVHGVKDRRVPIDQSRRMAASLATHNKPHELIEVPNAGHSFSKRRDRRLYHEEILKFLATHLPSPHNPQQP